MVATVTPTLRVVGLDLSMTATGICGPDGETVTVKTRAVSDRRLVDIANAAYEISKGCDLAVIEDLPTHAKSAGITGMVHGAVRAALLGVGIPYVLITPASLKKYATGKGNAGKPDMAVAAFKRAGLEFGDDNQVDAWWLRAMALDYYGEPPVAVPQVQRAALAGVKDWPAVVS